jgi:type IV pilus assembly protein PilY1
MRKISYVLFGFVLITAAIFIRTNRLQADDTDLFITQIPPDALIILDKSGSMNNKPDGTSGSSPNRRIDIARSVIYNFLDDNKSGTIDSTDENSLNMRLGFMRFWNSSNNDDNEPTTGSIKVLSNIGSNYAAIWTQVSLITELSGLGGTPLAAALAEAKTHFTRDVNPPDTAIACRQKFVIMITDGIDTYACGGNGVDPGSGSESVNPGMWRRRLATVHQAKGLYDAGIKVFFVGFGGTLPESLKRTLNWAAKYGGTDNPSDLNSGDPSAYDVSIYGDPCTVPDASAAAADPGNYPLSGYAFLATDASGLTEAIKTIATYIQEKSYAFTAPTNPSIRIVDKDVVYISSFIPNSTPFWKGVMQAYQLNADGTLPLDNDGYPLYSSLIWDASERLKAVAPGARNIHTYAGNALKSFVYENLTNADLDVSSDLDRQNLINHIRGSADPYDVDKDNNFIEMRDWKLGDIFHSNAVVVGSPSAFFEDQGFNGSGGFYETNKNRAKVILAGANDGMLHAFDASTGFEKWGFIPNSLLNNLKSMIAIHTFYVDSSPKVADVWLYDNSTDKSKSAAQWKTVLVCGLRKGGKTNVVLGTNGNNYTCIKNHTAAAENRPITGASWATYWAQQGTGGGTWVAGTGYFAKTWRYFALDITDTLTPKYLWEFPNPSDGATLAKVGQSWSEPAIGRVKVEIGGDLYERWVAFIGGGFDYTNSTGKAFFVVDLKTGEIIKEFSGLSDMNYSFTAPPTAVDTNSDGYVDKVYIGDLKGQMWVFDVSFHDDTKKSNSQWSGKVLFKAPTTEKHTIYYQPAVAFDQLGNPWVYFGTGDREYPKDLTNPAERFYAVIDDGLATYPRQEIDLADLTSTSTNTFTDVRVNDSTKKGWFFILAKASDRLEKVLAKPMVFNRLVYFTTYTYTQTSDPCSVLGEARLYIVEYLSGGGALTVDEMSDLAGTAGDRSTKFGVGIPSSPVIRVDATGKASVIIGSTSGQVYSASAFSPSSNKQFLYWREISE